jgi:hypothetical protein
MNLDAGLRRHDKLHPSEDWGFQPNEKLLRADKDHLRACTRIKKTPAGILLGRRCEKYSED